MDIYIYIHIDIDIYFAKCSSSHRFRGRPGTSDAYVGGTLGGRETSKTSYLGFRVLGFRGLGV